MTPYFHCRTCICPTVQYLGPGQFVLREHPIVFTDSRGIVWVAPIDTVTDGGTIPWIAEPLVGKDLDSPLLPAYILHDRHYQLAPANESGFFAANQSWERRETDRMLREAGELLAPAWKVQLIYQGVRVGGWKPWRDHAISNGRKR